MSPFEHREYNPNQIRKAGKILRKCNDLASGECEEALRVLVNFRALHAVALNTFQATLRARLDKIDKNAIVAQRIKRLPTILDKLKRYSHMQLDTMQDIGGIRAIVNTVSELKKLREVYISFKGFPHELVENKDYIECPKSSGYRGYHLVYKYYSAEKCPQEKEEYKGLRVEIQMRTRLQHAWATAVETFEAFLGEKLKSSEGDSGILDFFKYVSSAFALMEKEAVLKEHEAFSEKEIYKRVVDYVKELHIMEQIKVFSLLTKDISDNKRKKGYGVLILDTRDKSVSFRHYYDSQSQEAYDSYAREEERSINDSNRQVVLVKTDSVEKLRKAYPNYFADLGAFIQNIDKIVRLVNV